MSRAGLYVGLMSGTSLDSIDAALIRIDGASANLIASHTKPLASGLRQQLLALAEGYSTTLEELGEADREIAVHFAEAVQELLTRAGIPAEDVVAIGSHGQTVRHRPCRGGSGRGFTLQIGDPNTIAEMTGICTVADFRRRDVAAGGQGAPLVPAFHQAVFAKRGVDRVIANIGGMANVSLLPANGSIARGFDTGPGNALMDAWTTTHSGMPYDEDGLWARSGRVNDTLLTELLRHPFLHLAPPKSTGREDFNIEWLGKVIIDLALDISPRDVQATLLDYTAQTLAAGIIGSMPECTDVFLCGGGAKNSALVGRLSTLLGDRRVDTTAPLGVHPDWVEACAFAWLAHQALTMCPGNLPSVTGAARPVVLGGIYPGNQNHVEGSA